jgi:aromatic ring-opening dioxygenase catalytic subunit (LigB family)
MGELVGVFAATHGPLIAREWERLPSAVRERLTASFDELGRRLRASRPEILIVVSPDHWVNFFINNLPAVCIGIGAEHDGPPEAFMKPVFPHRTLTGHGGLARHLLRTALAEGFDPALSHRLTLDHGFCIPLWRMALDPMPMIVPIVVNSIEEPMPSIRRCLEWGRVIAKGVASYPENLRVALLGTGGLSHSIGEPTMGDIEEDFDDLCIQLFATASDAELSAALEERLQTAGNGGHEVRDWVIAHAAAGGRGFDLIDYAPLPEVYAGCAFAEWRRDTEKRRDAR